MTTLQHFQLNYGKQVIDAIGKLGYLRSLTKDKAIEEEHLIPAFEHVERTYDKPVPSFIDRHIFNWYGATLVEDVENMALQIFNTYGTEPQMLLFAIEDFFAIATRSLNLPRE